MDVRAITAHGNTTPEEDVKSFNIVFIYEPPPPIQVTSSNPASPPVSLTFEPSHSLGVPGSTVSVEVAVYDARGRKIKILEYGDFASGKIYDTSWDGTGSDGNLVPAGVYFITMRSGGRTVAKKLMMIP